MKWKDSKTGEVSIDDKENVKRFSSYYWMATSELYRETFHELVHAPKEKMYITGYPRNVSFIIKPMNDNMEQLKAEHPGSKWIIYMPTHRNFGKTGNAYINIDSLKMVDSELRKKNVFMVYKPHVHELQNFLEYEDVFTNIVLAKDQKVWGDVYSYLHYFDLLISDYSSVTTDFMCSGKPVVLFAYDIEDYKTGDAGLMDYFWTMPGGPICTSWEDTLKNTFDLLENDTWKEERERCRVAYHQYNDGHNTERVYQKVCEILHLKQKKKAN